MNYILYGVNRVAKDFLYIFNKLHVLYFIDDQPCNSTFMGYDVYPAAKVKERNDEATVIICDFDKTDKEKCLKSFGFIYKQDYFYEEDFFADLDEIKIPHDRKIAVWGTGMVASSFAKKEIQYQIELFIDSYKREGRFLGKEVAAPEEVEDWKNYFIIVAVEKDGEIRGKLQEYGLQENLDYVGYQKITGLPSSLLRKTIFDRSFYEVKCSTMLNHLEIFRHGDTRCCCTTFVRQNLDNIFEKSAHELWHSVLHRIMCLSSENQTFSFCDQNMCPLFIDKKKQLTGTVSNKPYQEMEDKPKVLAVGYDATCNLACTTCRKELYVAKGQVKEENRRITKAIMEDYLPYCNFLILAGDGEVFASQEYASLYQSEQCNPPYIRLLSNGLLFNEKNWKSFINGKTGAIFLTVSVDAATRETYEKIRRNGSFQVLKKNMEFASELRKSGALKYFRMNFVVQRENFREMIPFVQWGEELGTDEVFFTKILNWGTYTQEQFAHISMMEEDGGTPKQELKEILNHPVMSKSIVDLGTIKYSHKIDPIRSVGNYYMWELEKRGGKLFC